AHHIKLQQKFLANWECKDLLISFLNAKMNSLQSFSLLARILSVLQNFQQYFTLWDFCCFWQKLVYAKTF
ncbi:hypothetical protein, partial [Pseudomonas syringae]|uniref:hypothetical protein n=1 Tax=Pseudomonas syringae TaxID=317 RepID=UPI0034D69C29